MRRWLPGLRGWIALCGTAATLLLLALFWSSRFVTGRRAVFHLDRARAHLASREFPQARAELRASLRLQPDGVEPRRQLAAMELGLGEWELAFLELESLAELHPDDAESWMALADLMVKRGWLEAPEAALDRALEAEPQRAEPHAARADLRFRLGRYHGARVDADAALASAAASSDAARSARLTLARVALRTRGTPPPGAEDGVPAPAPPRRSRDDAQIDVGGLGTWSREAWPGRLGEVRRQLEARIRQQSWTEAQAIVDSAHRAYPDGVFAPYLRGVLELARGNAEEAERHLSEALVAAPRNPAVVAALARAWSRKKNAAFAGEQLLRLAERDRSFALARYLAARAYVEARDPIHAEAALRRGLELQPDSPVPFQHLADYYFGLDRSPEALTVCEQGLERFPRNLALRMMLAQISASVGRIGEAARAYEAVLSARPDLDIVEYRLAMLLASREDEQASGQRAAQLLQDLRDDRPSDPLLVDVLGWLHYRSGDADRARDLLQAAVKNVPEEPRPHFHLAVLYVYEGRRDLARTELDAALGSARPFAERLDALRMLREEPAPSRRARAGVVPARH
jgi:tetratricopeptide (TPR) repeat protein